MLEETEKYEINYCIMWPSQLDPHFQSPLQNKS